MMCVKDHTLVANTSAIRKASRVSPRSSREWPNSVLLTCFATFLLVALLLTWFAVTVGDTPPTIDAAVNQWFAETLASQQWLVWIAAGIGTATSPVYSTVLAALVIAGLLLAKHYRLAGFVALSALLGVITAGTVKALVGRNRPPGAAEYVSDLDKSFPSGHTMAGIYLYGAVAIALWLLARSSASPVWKPLAVALGVLGLLLGLTRLMIGVHWFTDVLAGLAYGFAVLFLSLALVHPETESERSGARDPVAPGSV